MSHGISAARYAKPEPEEGYPSNALVVVTRNTGVVEHRYINDDVDGGGMSAFIAEGGVVEPYIEEPIVVNSDHIRAEASRRMQKLLGARDKDNLTNIISNANREAIRLLNKGRDNWTQEETVRAQTLEAVDTVIEKIRESSNVLESSLVSDFKDDTHWPVETKGF